MKIQFVKGAKLFDDTNRNYIRYINTAVLATFMNKYTMHFRYTGKATLEKIPDLDKSFIYVVIQDNPFGTIANLIHELIHWVIFKFFCNSRKLHKLLDKIDSGQ